MSTLIPVILLVVLLLSVVGIVTFLKTRSPILRYVGAIALLFAAFYGGAAYLHTYEPNEGISPIVFRVVYGIIVLSCLFGAWKLIRGPSGTGDKPQ